MNYFLRNFAFRLFFSRKLAFFVLIISFIFLNIINIGLASDDFLKTQIEEKNKELNVIKSQILETQKKLDEVETQGQSLKKEISLIDYRIRQLVLGIRSSEINIKKLTLEIKELNTNLGETKKQTNNKKETIGLLLREMQRKHNEDLLIRFLKSRTLSDSMLEFHSFINFQNSLTSEISRLNNLTEETDIKLKESIEKKEELKIENLNLKSRRNIINEQKNLRQNVLTQTKNQEKLYQAGLKKLQKQQREIAEEIEKIEVGLRPKINLGFLPQKGRGVLMMPVRGILTQEYGYTRFARHSFKGRFHNGIDIGAPIGTPVFSAEDGRVVAFGDQDRTCPRASAGKYIVIKHNNNLTTLYAHLSKIIITHNQQVKRGEIIGYVGSSGYSTGPHLHFTVYDSNTFYMGHSRLCGPMPLGGTLNPMDYL